MLHGDVGEVVFFDPLDDIDPKSGTNLNAVEECVELPKAAMATSRGAIHPRP
jgi:hypothetical protein